MPSECTCARERERASRSVRKCFNQRDLSCPHHHIWATCARGYVCCRSVWGLRAHVSGAYSYVPMAWWWWRLLLKEVCHHKQASSKELSWASTCLTIHIHAAIVAIETGLADTCPNKLEDLIHHQTKCLWHAAEQTHKHESEGGLSRGCTWAYLLVSNTTIIMISHNVTLHSDMNH